MLSSFSRSGKTGRKKRVKKPLSLCRQCGQLVKTTKNVFCSVKCMANSKKKRHQVTCAQCQKPMEVLENRFKARSFFLCSTECANDLYSKQRQAAIERDKQNRLNKQEEKQRKSTSLENRWLRKIKQELKSRLLRSDCDKWEEKCSAAIRTMKRISTVVDRIIIVTDWAYWSRENQRRMMAKDKTLESSNWMKKCHSTSCNWRKKKG